MVLHLAHFVAGDGLGGRALDLVQALMQMEGGSNQRFELGYARLLQLLLLLRRLVGR